MAKHQHNLGTCQRCADDVVTVMGAKEHRLGDMAGNEKTKMGPKGCTATTVAWSKFWCSQCIA